MGLQLCLGEVETKTFGYAKNLKIIRLWTSEGFGKKPGHYIKKVNQTHKGRTVDTK